VSGSDDCKSLVGEKVGVQTYNAVGVQGKPDLDRPSVAIQADGIGSLRDKSEKAKVPDENADDHPYALGPFNQNVPAGSPGVCSASQLSPAIQNIAKIPGDPDAGKKDTPAVKLEYTWSNVQFLVTSQYYGSQFVADVSVTTIKDACVYRAQGLYPYVDC